MTKKWFSVSAFLTAWIFAFSLLSNCYCAPVAIVPEHSAQSDMQSKMPAHCQHHSDAAKQKKSDCSPRVNADQFEVAAAQAHFDLKIQAETFIAPEILFAPHFLSEKISENSLLNASPPPQFFLLHHSFLI